VTVKKRFPEELNLDWIQRVSISDGVVDIPGTSEEKPQGAEEEEKREHLLPREIFHLMVKKGAEE
jgi:hypothetical protein